MTVEKLCSLPSEHDNVLGYKIHIENLNMVFSLFCENVSHFEIIFDDVQSYKFTPDDLSHFSDDIVLNALQMDTDHKWIEEFRVPSDIHRSFLTKHHLYIAHVSDVGVLEVISMTARLHNPTEQRAI